MEDKLAPVRASSDPVFRLLPDLFMLLDILVRLGQRRFPLCQPHAPPHLQANANGRSHSDNNRQSPYAYLDADQAPNLHRYPAPQRNNRTALPHTATRNNNLTAAHTRANVDTDMDANPDQDTQVNADSDANANSNANTNSDANANSNANANPHTDATPLSSGVLL